MDNGSDPVKFREERSGSWHPRLGHPVPSAGSLADSKDHLKLQAVRASKKVTNVIECVSLNSRPQAAAREGPFCDARRRCSSSPGWKAPAPAAVLGSEAVAGKGGPLSRARVVSVFLRIL